jgi:hypothetical protein
MEVAQTNANEAKELPMFQANTVPKRKRYARQFLAR